MLSTKAKIIGIVAVGVVGTSMSVAIPLIIKKNKENKENNKKFDFASDLAKIQNFTSNKLKSKLKLAIGSKSKNQSVTSTELGIEVNLSKGVTAEYKINSIYNLETGIVKIDVILKKDKEKSNSKTIAVTAKDMAFASDLSKIITTIVSSKDKSEFGRLFLTKDSETSANDLGIIEPSFSSGVTATYKVKKAYSSISGKVVLNVTLTNDAGISITKSLIVVAKNSVWANDLAKIVNAVSTKTKEELDKIANLKIKKAIVTKKIIGYTQPNTEALLSYKIKKGYDSVTGKVIVTVTLTKHSLTITKDIVLSAEDAAFDYTEYLSKIVNTISSKNKEDLNTDISSLEVNQFVQADDLGYILPTLPEEVTAKLSIETKYNNATGKVVVKITLSKMWEASVTKEFVVIANDSHLAVDLGKIISSISSKDKDALSKTTTLLASDSTTSAGDLGFAEPSLTTSGVSATYKVKTPYDASKGSVVVIVTLVDGEISLSKEITIVANDSQLAIDLGKIISSISSKDKAALSATAELSTSDSNTSASDLGFAEPSLETAGVSVTYKVKTPYDVSKGSVVVIVTLVDGEISLSKEIAIVANDSHLAVDLGKIISSISSKDKEALSTTTTLSTSDSTTSASRLGFAEPSLTTSGVSATYKVKTPYDASKGSVVVIVTLVDGEISLSKEITIVANDSQLAVDLGKIISSISSKDKEALSTTTTLSTSDSTTSASDLGFAEPSLTTAGVSVTYKVKTPYDVFKGSVVVIVTLVDGEISLSKEITIVANDSHLAVDLGKIISSISSKDKDALSTTTTLSTSDSTTSASDLGFAQPSLTTAGVSVTYKVKTPYDASKGSVVVIVTLVDGEISLSKEITIVANNSQLAVDLGRIISSNSSKDKAALSTTTTLLTSDSTTSASDLGFAEPSLTTAGVSVTYKVKTPYDASKGSVVVIVTLVDGEISLSKEITIKAKE